MAGGLVDLFVAHCSVGDADRGQLEALLATSLDQARRAWPGIVVDERQFVAYLAERIPSDEPPAAALALLHVDDLYLACACATGLPAALEAFDRKRLDLVPGYLAHVNSSPAFADEVIQRLREKLFVSEPPAPPRITTYSGRGTLSKWVGITAQRIGISILRGGGARSRREALAEMLPLTATPELEYLRARYRVAFREAFSEALRGLDDRQRVLLRLSVVKAMSQESIARLYSVNQSTVARWLTTARNSILETMQAFLREQLRVDTAEFHSLAAVVRSDLDLSLGRLLDEDE